MYSMTDTVHITIYSTHIKYTTLLIVYYYFLHLLTHLMYQFDGISTEIYIYIYITIKGHTLQYTSLTMAQLKTFQGLIFLF